MYPPGLGSTAMVLRYLLEKIKDCALVQAGFPLDLKTMVLNHPVQERPGVAVLLLQVVQPAHDLIQTQTGIQSD